MNESMTTPANFIPIIITNETEARQIMSGELMMSLAIPKDVADKLDSMIPSELKGKSMRQQMREGSLINYSLFGAVGRSLYPLEFANHKFQCLSEKYSTLGTHVIVIYNPKEFLYRVNEYYSINQPNVMSVEIAAVEYKNNVIDPETYDIFARPPKEAWKREIYMVAAMKQSVALGEGTRRQDELISIGNLSDIAVTVRIEDLIESRFPKQIEDQQYVNYMDSFTMPNKETAGWELSAAANIQNISPVEKWIQIFEEYLPKEEWKPTAFVDRLYSDGDSMARLAFHNNNGVDKIFFYINRVEFVFSDYSERERQLVKNILSTIHTECSTDFCLMMMEVNADLGMVEEKWLADYEGWHVEKSFVRENLVYSQTLTMDYRMSENIFGVSMGKKSWHYTTSISTPSNETLRWYNVETVMNFYDDADRENMKNIENLMKGNVYAGFHQM